MNIWIKRVDKEPNKSIENWLNYDNLIEIQNIKFQKMSNNKSDSNIWSYNTNNNRSKNNLGRSQNNLDRGRGYRINNNSRGIGC